MWRGWFGAAVVVLGAGCGKTASHGASATGDDASAVATADMASWIRARARAECEQDARCFDGTARRYTSVEACLDETLAYVDETPYSNGIHSLYRRELQLACPFGTHADFQGAAPPYPELAAYCQCLPGAESNPGSAACE